MNKIDMHIHTAEVSPCGSIPAETLVNLYHEKGYNGLVITDHFFKGYFDDLGKMNWADKVGRYLEGYKKAKSVGDVLEMNVLLGMEIRLEADANDYLVYGIDEDYLIANPGLYDLSVDAFVEKVKGPSRMVFQAHPFRVGMHRDYVHLLDGFEVYNGNRRHDSKIDLGKALINGTEWIGLSGSDFHELEDLALGGIVTDEAVSDVAGLIEVLRSKDFRMIEEGLVD